MGMSADTGHIRLFVLTQLDRGGLSRAKRIGNVENM